MMNYFQDGTTPPHPNTASNFPHDANVKRRKDAAERKITQLENKLHDRNEVVAELLQEHVQLKKELGEL